jgi:hypothetical protein
MTTPAIEKIDGEIAVLQAEIARIEVLPAPVGERYAAVEASLRACEEAYRTHGLQPAGHPDAQRIVVGMCMVVGADKVLKAEHQRIAALGEGMAAADKERRLTHLRAALLAAACRRELALMDLPGSLLAPREVHPELIVYPRAELERIAAR